MVLRSPTVARHTARTAGWWYVANIVTGSIAAVLPMRKMQTLASTANLLATIAYVVVTILLFQLFKPVNKRVSLVAALFSFLGCLAAFIDVFRRPPEHISPLMFFGAYCLRLGYLIVRSWFLPRILGVFLAIGGLGWLTFVLPSLSKQLFPYNMVPGIVSETLFTIWLVMPSVNEVQRQSQASGASMSRVRNSVSASGV